MKAKDAGTETSGNFVKDSKVHLRGYTSTSRVMDIACQFAINDLKEYQVPVLFEITFEGQEGLFEMSGDYSAYSSEMEVLIQDGLEYRVTANEINVMYLESQ